jgi:hypothetical protein
MNEIYGRPNGPRLVRVPGGFMLTGDTGGVMDKVDTLWFVKSVLDVFVSLLIEGVDGKGR